MKASIILSAIILFVSCSKDKKDETPPQLTVPFINTAKTDRFWPFGSEIAPGKYNCAYEITVTDANLDVVTSSGGKVYAVRANDNFPDYEIDIIPYANSVYHLIYDHVKNPLVSVGQQLNAGDILGKVGDGARTELQINDDRIGKSVCPSQFGNAVFNNAFDQARTISNAKPGTDYANTCLMMEVEN
jgi:hypothetical protein